MIEIHLVSITCLKQSEKDGDELYCNFKTQNSRGKTIGTERVPKEIGFWPLHTGETRPINHVLYVGDEESGLEFTFTLMEMDIVKIVQPSISLIGSWVDDFIGQLKIKVTPLGRVTWVPGRYAQAAEEEPDGTRAFRLTGNKSIYVVRLKALDT